MKKILYLIIPVIAAFTFIQCETPGSPDFTLSNTISTPLIAESNFQFLGAKNALIDTTNEDLRELFEIDGENFITISQEEQFNFGDLRDAVPSVDVEPTAFESEVGEIELSDFSSQENGNLGEANFEELTGQPEPLEQGELIPGAQSPSPVNIILETDFFVSAKIKRGGIELSVRNELGFDLIDLTLELYSASSSLGTVIISNFDHNTTRTETLIIVENPGTDPEVELRDLNADVSISWNTQAMQDNSGSLIINHVTGQQLIASEVDAVIQSQKFYSNGTSVFSDDEFEFTEPTHYVELSSGVLSIQNIINSIDVDIELFEISFPDLRKSPYSESDSLVIRFDESQSIPRNNTTPVSRSSDLEDVRIYAQNNLVEYNIYALTEDTRQKEGTDSRVLHETDRITAEVVMSDLEIREVFGVIANRQILLNSDIASDGMGADLMNDFDAEVIEIDGIDEISRRTEGIEFTQASLSVNYNTNIDVQTTVIGAFLGIDANGNEFFLQGAQGTDAEVQDNAPTEKLLQNGSPIPVSNLIQFEIKPGQSDGDILSNTFDKSNSNIINFLNRLPTSIRFVGIVNLNEDVNAGRIKNPVRFDPAISINIPLALRADRASFTDTTAANLKELPGPEDEATLEEGSVIIRYTNRIPLGINLELEFLTEDGALITSVPLIDDSSIEFLPATVGSGGFSISPAEDFTVITLNRSQLDQMNLTRNVRLIAGLSTTASEEIRIRSSDNIDVSISGKFIIRNKIE